MNKKVFSLVIALVAVMVLALPVFAAGTAVTEVFVGAGSSVSSYSSIVYTTTGNNCYVIGTNKDYSNAYLAVSITTSSNSVIGASTKNFAPGVTNGTGPKVNLSSNTGYKAYGYYGNGPSRGTAKAVLP